MKNIVKSKIKYLVILIVTVMIMGSCEDKVIRDADYPDQLIYMPAASYNNYMINTVPAAVGAVPTPGYPTRFTVDTVSRKFNVLLGVYRSGIDLKGSFVVDIAVKNDTVNKLLAIVDMLPAGTLILPADKYSLPASIVMKDGEELGKFDLSVDLDFLLANYPAQFFAVAVGISSIDRKTNPALATTIIVIDTKIMKPTASFTSVFSALDPLTVIFTNKSSYGTRFTWDFGDGSPAKVTTSMVNETKVSHTYASGSWDVKLTVQGIADYADTAVYNAVQVVP